MNCDALGSELVSFQFGLLEDPRRAEVEQHLVGCRDCLESCLRLKRDVETGAAEPGPSPALRERIRSSLSREMTERAGPKWRAWERPLALGLAAATVALALLTTHHLTSSPAVEPARTHAAPAQP